MPVTAYSRTLLGPKPNNVVFQCVSNGTVVREISIYAEKDKTIVTETELRHDNKTNKGIMHPVHVNVHPKYSYAKSEFIGRVCVAAAEMGNNTDSNELENMFARSGRSGGP